MKKHYCLILDWNEINLERSDIKIIANYLPQYHQIPENDMWWGEGYTDWVATRNAKPVYKGHLQPRVPLNENYYDLADPSTIEWQAKLARKYGIWGFGIYHYWFSSKQNLLTAPAENLLQHPEIDINYLFIWDNTSWIRSWSNVKGNDWAPSFDSNKELADVTDSTRTSGILARLDYGGEESWKKHFDYLLPHFLDSRYMKIEGKPVLAFMCPNHDESALMQMFAYWNNLATQHDLPGVIPLARNSWKGRTFEYGFDYRPSSTNSIRDLITTGVSNRLNKIHPHLRKRNYGRVWKGILASARKTKDPKTFFSGFVQYDDTPRRGDKSLIIADGSPSMFQQYLSKLIDISVSQNKEYLFLTAWNEWGEGAYLEPDMQDGYAYLEAVRASLEKNY